MINLANASFRFAGQNKLKFIPNSKWMLNSDCNLFQTLFFFLVLSPLFYYVNTVVFVAGTMRSAKRSLVMRPDVVVRVKRKFSPNSVKRCRFAKMNWKILINHRWCAWQSLHWKSKTCCNYVSNRLINFTWNYSLCLSGKFMNAYIPPFFTVKFGDAAKDKVEDQLLHDIDENIVMKALDGFLIVLSTDGNVVYVSENIHEYIGIQQVLILSANKYKKKLNQTRPFNWHLFTKRFCLGICRLRSLETRFGSTCISAITPNYVTLWKRTPRIRRMAIWHIAVLWFALNAHWPAAVAVSTSRVQPTRYVHRIGFNFVSAPFMPCNKLFSNE